MQTQDWLSLPWADGRTETRTCQWMPQISCSNVTYKNNMPHQQKQRWLHQGSDTPFLQWKFPNVQCNIHNRNAIWTVQGLPTRHKTKFYNTWFLHILIFVNKKLHQHRWQIKYTHSDRNLKFQQLLHLTGNDFGALEHCHININILTLT